MNTIPCNQSYISLVYLTDPFGTGFKSRVTVDSERPRIVGEGGSSGSEIYNYKNSK